MAETEVKGDKYFNEGLTAIIQQEGGAYKKDRAAQQGTPFIQQQPVHLFNAAESDHYRVYYPENGIIAREAMPDQIVKCPNHGGKKQQAGKQFF